MTSSPFILSATDHGPMIVNRLDFNVATLPNGQRTAFGVGYQVLETGSHDPQEIDEIKRLLDLRSRVGNPPQLVVDCGANIGIHTLALAKYADFSGTIIAIEAQERIFYALAGNIALNNLFNVRAIWAAVGKECGVLNAPTPNYRIPGSFGSFELRRGANTENIGQSINYDDTTPIPIITIDSLKLARLDLIKIDIEGMEIDALVGAEITIRKFNPIIVVERIKSNEIGLRAWLELRDYFVTPSGMNFIAISKHDPAYEHFVKPTA